MDAVETTVAGASVSARLTSMLSAFHIGHALANYPSGQGNEPEWLHTLGQISGVLLMLELCFALLLVCALAFGIAYAMHWTHSNVTPLLERSSDQARRAMAVVERSSDRVVEGIAEFHGRRQGIEAALRVFFFGPKAAASLLNGRKPLALPAEEPATLLRPAETLPFPPDQLPIQEEATETYIARPVAASDHPPQPLRQEPTWRGLPVGNASVARETSGRSGSDAQAIVTVARPWRQVGRAGTASGARAGSSRGVPAIG